MDRIFIGSLQRGEMGAIRIATARTMEALGVQPVMFETGAAAADAPRPVLLERIASCAAPLLILGAEYGQPRTSVAATRALLAARPARFPHMTLFPPE